MRLFSLSLLLFCSMASAEEKAEPAPEGGGNSVMQALPKEQKEYIEKAAKLSSLSNRIIEHEKRFSEVVHWKDAAKTQDDKQRWIKELNRVARDRNKDVDAYNRIKMDVKLRYPKEGEALERRYGTLQKKSVEELEGVAGLDELLTRIKKVIDQKYAPFLIEEEKRNQLQPTVVKSTEEERPKRLRLEK